MNDEPKPQEDLAHFMSLWDDALDRMGSKLSPLNPTPQAYTHEEGPEPYEISAVELLQERRRSASQPLDWRDMLLLSEDIDRVFNPERYEESSKKELGDLATNVANSPNPTKPTIVGKDQELVVTQDFTDGEALRELNDLKIRIEALERDVHAAEVNGTQKSENKLHKEVDSLRSRIEELSNKLTPSPFDNND